MSYEQLVAHHRRLAHLGHVHAIVDWDEATMMPTGGGPARADAMATLAELTHELATESRVRDWIEIAESDTTDLDAWQRANLDEMRRDWNRAHALASDLVGERARRRARCQQAWRSMRAENDWAGFRPELESVFEIERTCAAALGEALGLSPYDALLDEYEPGSTRADLDRWFAPLNEFLPDFTREAAAAATAPVRSAGPYAVDAQRALGLELMRSAGFDFEHGRLDVSHHPFCGGVPSDVRITTRYDEADFTSALMGVLHETGHAKYEQGLPEAWRDQPVGRARSMSMHESQSLLMEMQVSRGRAFTTFTAAKVVSAFPSVAAAEPRAFSVENLVLGNLHVSPGKIRVDADEVTYPSHVLLRTAIEIDLFDGALTIADLPDRWEHEMRGRLGVDTGGDYRDGCMQDVHWPCGLFGYFPTYTLGAMRAAQFYRAADRAIDGLDDSIRAGDLHELDAWLREHVWQRASSVDSETIMHDATGRGLTADDYIAHLGRRYGVRAK